MQDRFSIPVRGTQPPMAVCFASDDRFAPHLGVALLSILRSKAPDDRFRFYILDGGISAENRAKIESLGSPHEAEIQFVKMSNELFADFPISYDCWTRVVYYRLMIAEVVPNENKMLYLDSDIIVRKSLAPLFRIDLTDIDFCGAADVIEDEHRARLKNHGLAIDHYCNAGVMLINIDEWRRRRLFSFFCEFIRDHREALMFQDQDVVNVTLQNRMKMLDQQWNTQTSEMAVCRKSGFNRAAADAAIVHFVGPKPWQPGNRSPHRKFYHDCWKNSPWKENYPRYRRLSRLYGPRILLKQIRKKLIRFRWTKDEKYVILLGRTVYGKTRLEK